MKLKRYLNLIFVLLTTPALALNDCETHEPCPLEQKCTCTVPAYSNYERYYYFNFQDLVPNHFYQCHLEDSLLHITAVLGQSTFPAGSSWQLDSTSMHTPMTLLVNTTGQTKDKDLLIIKYFVPGTDMPTQVSASCTLLV